MNRDQCFHSTRMLLASVLMCTLSVVGANAAAAVFNVIDLGTLSQGSWVVVRGPNSAGAAAGGGNLANAPFGPRRGFVFQNGAAIRQFTGLAGSDDATVFGVNDTGGVVGNSNTATGVRAFAGTATGATRELAPLPGDTASAAFAVNNLGQAVGYSSGPTGQRPVIWDANGTPTPLPGSSPGASIGLAAGVNNRGDAAGVLGTDTGRRAILWVNGQAPTQLAPIAGQAASEAFAINTRGDVVGYSGTGSNVRRATLWPAGGAAVDLGTLPGGNYSQAFGTNDVGDIVGASTIVSTNEEARAFLWTRNGGMQDLNTLIPPSPFVLTKAVGINNLGMILATGNDTHPTDPALAGSEGHEMPVRIFLLVR